MASIKQSFCHGMDPVVRKTLRTQLKQVFCATAVSSLAVLSTQAMPANSGSSAPSSIELTAEQRELRAIYQELVEINTTNSVGSCTKAAKAMAVHLKKAGYTDQEVSILVPPGGPEKGNLVARLRANDVTGAKDQSGQAKKPLLLLAHIDVVEAKREDWVRDPFKLIEEDGRFYARGASDDKAMAAILVENMMRYKRDKTKLKRDLILALTCDEEIIPSPFNGVEFLLKHHRPLIDAEFALNEGSGGSGLMDKSGKPIRNGVQAGEKTFQTFQLEITNTGGHSSLPRKDNAIYRLSEALSRLGRFDFPFRLIPTTRAYLEIMSDLEGGAKGADMKGVLREPVDQEALVRFTASSPFNNATVRTTCVATEVNAGHASNALPQRAKATVNCRILPGETVEQTQATLTEVVADKDIKITQLGVATIAPAASLDTEVVKHARALTQEMWPGIPLVPTLSPGATDGRFLNTVGIQTYGIMGLFHYPEGPNSHGLNENLPVKSLYEGQKFLYELAKRIAQ